MSLDPADILFTEYASIKDRPGFDIDDSVLLLEKIYEIFAVRRNVTLPYYDDNGQTQCIPHPDNVRHQTQVEVELTTSVLRSGVVQGVRGEAIAVLSAGGGGPYKFVTWGTLLRAIARAIVKEPGNAKMQQFFARGLA